MSEETPKAPPLVAPLIGGIVFGAWVTAVAAAVIIDQREHYPYPAENRGFELSAQERHGLREQTIPEMWSVVHFSSSYNRPGADAYASLGATQCTITIPADKYSIAFNADDEFSPTFSGPPRGTDLATIIAHELLHCIRGRWHKE